MHKLSKDDLFTLEDYADARAGFRAEVIAHKRNRQVTLGEHVTLLFEDHITVKYQIQEMLRVERIFERQGIEEELSAYNPLIPDGTNFKATMMVEYEDPEERRQALAGLRGIEDRVWLRVEQGEPVYAIADEDLERSNDEKTSAVHFLRFELSDRARAAVHAGGSLEIGIDHENYQATSGPLATAVRDALAEDLASPDA